MNLSGVYFQSNFAAIYLAPRGYVSMEILTTFMILSYVFLFSVMMILFHILRSDYDSNLQWVKVLALGTEKEKAEAIEKAERQRPHQHAFMLGFTIVLFLAIACVWTWSFLRAIESPDSETIEVTVLPVRGWNATPWPGKWGGP